jgi:hypothetical protein
MPQRVQVFAQVTKNARRNFWLCVALAPVILTGVSLQAGHSFLGSTFTPSLFTRSRTPRMLDPFPSS